MLINIVRHEWRSLRADSTLWAITALLIVAIGFGAHNGAAWVRFQKDTLRKASNEEQDRLKSLSRAIVDADAGRIKPSPFADPRSPSVAGRTLAVRYAMLPPGPMAALAIGQSDLYPYYFKVSTLSKQTFLNNDEIENPLHLLSGRFDLAFVILYLYPLVILALSYNLLSSEKEAGTLAITLSQPVRLSRLVLGKAAVRFGFVMAVGAVLSLAGMMVEGTSLASFGAGFRFLLWFLVVAVYGLFWFALAVAVNGFGASSATNAMVLAAFWLTFVLLIPSLLNVTVKSLYPVPSRVALIQAVREASAKASGEGDRLLSRYYGDHPEMATGRTSATDFAATALAAQEEVERQIQPVLDRFDRQLRQQQAVVDRYQFLSPAILAQASLYEIAGTGIHRYQDFLSAVDRFHQLWQRAFYPRILKNERFTTQDVNQLPKFELGEEPAAEVLRGAAASLTGLLIAALLAMTLAIWTLQRFPVVGR